MAHGLVEGLAVTTVPPKSDFDKGLEGLFLDLSESEAIIDSHDHAIMAMSKKSLLYSV